VPELAAQFGTTPQIHRRRAPLASYWLYRLAVKDHRRVCGAADPPAKKTGDGDTESVKYGLAGAEGFEPSTLGFEDRGSGVHRRPDASAQDEIQLTNVRLSPPTVANNGELGCRLGCHYARYLEAGPCKCPPNRVYWLNRLAYQAPKNGSDQALSRHPRLSSPGCSREQWIV